jgi:hypothetical protein
MRAQRAAQRIRAHSLPMTVIIHNLSRLNQQADDLFNQKKWIALRLVDNQLMNGFGKSLTPNNLFKRVSV